MNRFVRLVVASGGICGLVAALAVAPAVGASSSGANGVGNTMHLMAPLRPNNANSNRPSRGGSNNLAYRGGAVEHSPTVVLVEWGSQWVTNDPSGEIGILQGFLGGLYGTSDRWSTSTTQYCSNVSAGTTNCATFSSASYIQHGASSPLVQTYVDTSVAAPSQPTQSDLANEAIKIAGLVGNTADRQFVIATATHNSASGFGTQYCAWHSSTSSSSGNVAYTNLPYITDAGPSCGADFNSLGPNAGITIVEGHEYAESVTDAYPNGGWLDPTGAENGDKCAWINTGQGAAANVAFQNGTYPVQSLWSNTFNKNTGGCVTSYP